MPGVSFAGTWEVGTASTDVTVAFLAGVGDIGRGASLEGARRADDADAWPMGAETSFACFGDLGFKASIAEVGHLEVRESFPVVSVECVSGGSGRNVSRRLLE